MKKTIALLLIITSFVICSSGCKNLSADGKESTDTEIMTSEAVVHISKSKNILYAGTDEYSDERRRLWIKEYGVNYQPIPYDMSRDDMAVSFKVDYEPVKVRVPLISPVDPAFEETEFKLFIDSAVTTEINDNTVIAYVKNWGLGFSEWAHVMFITDTEGDEHVYYFRVQYTDPSVTEN